MDSRRGVPGGGLFPFTNSAGQNAPPPSSSPAPEPIPPPPVITQCHDALTVVPFSVPFTTTTPVSGGGAALATAVAAALPGTRLQVMDSLDYSKVTVSGKTDITIEAAPGQTPSITSAPGADDGCVVMVGVVSGLAMRGLMFFGNANVTGAQTADGMVGGTSVLGLTSLTRLIIEDCTFQEPDATVTDGGPGLQLHGTDGVLHNQIWLHRCVFINTGSDPEAALRDWGSCTISGFDQVYIQNCEVRRTAVLARATSTMKGFTFRSNNVVLEDCLVNDIGFGGNNVAFYSNDMPFGVTISGSSDIRNCVVYNTARAYRVTQAGATMMVTNSVANIDIPGIGNSGAVQKATVAQFTGSLTFRDSVVSLVPGEGTVYGSGATTPTHDHNDIFGGLVQVPLDPTEITVDPLFFDVASGCWVATAPECQTAAVDGGPVGIRYPGGEKIIWCNA